MVSHKCIKPSCSNVYEDEEPDAYYCPSCQELNKQIAQAITDKFKGTDPNEVTSPLKEYDAAPKFRGFIKVKLN